jgi:hypothetical protein
MVHWTKSRKCSFIAESAVYNAYFILHKMQKLKEKEFNFEHIQFGELGRHLVFLKTIFSSFYRLDESIVNRCHIISKVSVWYRTVLSWTVSNPIYGQLKHNCVEKIFLLSCCWYSWLYVNAICNKMMKTCICWIFCDGWLVYCFMSRIVDL